MEETKMRRFLNTVLEKMPAGWLDITTHRLDVYNEQLAKTEFLDKFEALFHKEEVDVSALDRLPTAYDYIRLGHPLSCVLEWGVSKLYGLSSENVISFSSQTIPILAVLRKNSLEGSATQILYTENLPKSFDATVIREVYGYHFDVQKVKEIPIDLEFKGSTIFVSQQESLTAFELSDNIDFYVQMYNELGSILMAKEAVDTAYISEIQHVRRRETVAMTPANCLVVLKGLVTQKALAKNEKDTVYKSAVLESIKEITQTNTTPIVGSSGLSIQYAIMMGLIHHASIQYPGKAIKFVVPTNCYGGTNDQARRVAACLANVAVVDLAVDGDNDMVQSIDAVLNTIALQDAVPFIIAEIPTNPRVEVPNLQKLKETLAVPRLSSNGEKAIAPLFILDQTFCPNIHFLGTGEILSEVMALSYASGSKFPSGGKCTAGYVVSNQKAKEVMVAIEKHLILCDNEATPLQYEILAKQLPTMNNRIEAAYLNTRDFVNFIEETLPEAKINFVSEELAAQGFTPSVFSLDLPTKGNTAEEKEAYKRALNLTLIEAMITEIPDESKYCVSYGQLKGCYWTIPATSTQGTTKEGDKDYIARVAVSANMDMNRHKKVFLDFVRQL